MKTLAIILALIGSPALAQGYYQPMQTFHGTTSNGGFIQEQTSSAGTFIQVTPPVAMPQANYYGAYPFYPGVTPAPLPIPTQVNLYGY